MRCRNYFNLLWCQSRLKVKHHNVAIRGHYFQKSYRHLFDLADSEVSISAFLASCKRFFKINLTI